MVAVGGEIGFNSEYKEKWGFIAKEKSGVGISGWKVTKPQGEGEILAKLTLWDFSLPQLY